MLRRRAYAVAMANSKRDNDYYLTRLQRIGRDDLVEKIQAGEMKVYAAAIETGLRKRRTAESRSTHLTYHWSRASVKERERFLMENFLQIDTLRKKLVQKVLDARKTTDEAQK